MDSNSLETFAAFAENSPDIIMLMTLSGEMVYLNPTAKQVLGIGDLGGEDRPSLSELFADAPLSAGQVLEEVIEKGSWRGEHRFIRLEDENHFRAGSNFYVINDPKSGKARYIANIARNVTKSRTEQDTEKEIKLNRLISEMSQWHFHSLEININALLEAISYHLEETKAVIYFFNEPKDALIPYASSAPLAYTSIPIATNPKYFEVYNLGKMISTTNAQADPIYQECTDQFLQEPTKALVDTPIYYQGRKHGLLRVCRATDESFPPYELAFIRYAAHYVFIYLNAEKQQATEKEIERLSLVAKQVTNGVLISDKNGLTEWVNEGFTKMSGYSLEELKNKTPGSILQGPETNPKTVGFIRQKLKEEQPFEVEIINYNKAGYPYWVLLHVTPVFDKHGRISGFIAVQMDISERKANEQMIEYAYGKLQESEKRQKQGKRKLEAINRKLAAQKVEIQHAYQELEETQQQLIDSEKLAALGQLIAGIAHEINTPLGAIQSTANVRAREIDYLKEKMIPFLDRLFQDTDKDRFVELLSLTLQNADAFFSHQERRKIKRGVEKELEAQEIANADAIADQLTELNLGRHSALFAAILKKPNGHEWLDMLYHLCIGINRNRTIKIAAEKASRVSFALKNYSRFEPTTEKEHVQLYKTIDEVLELYKSQTKNITILSDYHFKGEVLCYPNQLSQVWVNLVNNAIQAMEQKGTLKIALKQEGDHVICSFEDDGGGIPEKAQEKVFDKFFTTKPLGKGTGLGLDISKRIVQKHKGQIYFTSKEGEGTTFYVKLPKS